MFFYNIIIEDVDEIFVKASSYCSYRYIHSYGPLGLVFKVKIIDEKDNKTNDKVFKYTSIGRILFLRRMRKKGYKLIKIDKLTLRFSGNINDLLICYLLKMGSPFSPLEVAFYKNIAINDDYINNYCVPIQSVFTAKCIKWYF